ncbi:MAG: LemA family protein [Candidatus Krumholzibacteriota bacterium]|nr:LemA family protein [Candidatus Krumholzibacteriota bacterium]
MQLYVSIGLAAVVLIWSVVTYNRFLILRNRCRNGRSQIEVQLERRHELIPRLVDTVKGYAIHEREVLEKVARSRTEAIGTTGLPARTRAENNLAGTLRDLFAVSEAYPELRSDENFRDLQKELSETEDRIRFARQFYNDTVMRYNTLRGTFPPLLLAKVLGLEEERYFELADPPGDRPPPSRGKFPPLKSGK